MIVFLSLAMVVRNWDTYLESAGAFPDAVVGRVLQVRSLSSKRVESSAPGHYRVAAGLAQGARSLLDEYATDAQPTRVARRARLRVLHADQDQLAGHRVAGRVIPYVHSG